MIKEAESSAKLKLYSPMAKISLLVISSRATAVKVRGEQSLPLGAKLVENVPLIRG